MKMGKIRYIWKFYIRPVILLIGPNSPEGLRIRAEKLEVDGARLGGKG